MMLRRQSAYANHVRTCGVSAVSSCSCSCCCCRVDDDGRSSPPLPPEPARAADSVTVPAREAVEEEDLDGEAAGEGGGDHTVAVIETTNFF